MEKIELKKSENDKLEQIVKIIDSKSLEISIFQSALRSLFVEILKNNGVTEIEKWKWDIGSSSLVKVQELPKEEIKNDGQVTPNL